MTTIRCPECGNSVSSEAACCPKCGYPFSPKPDTGNPIVIAREGCFLQTLNVGCMIIFAIIGLLVLLIILGSMWQCSAADGATPNGRYDDRINTGFSGPLSPHLS